VNLRLAGLIAALLLAMSPAPFAAHHSIVATYDATKPITITGKVTEMRWGNPHSVLSMDVIAPDGKVVTWKIEMGGPANLLKSGFRKEEIFSTPITLQAWPARDGSLMAAGRLLTLPDGRQFDVHDTFAENLQMK
jgi:Family of unknown function (DUF6152)